MFPQTFRRFRSQSTVRICGYCILLFAWPTFVKGIQQWHYSQRFNSILFVTVIFPTILLATVKIGSRKKIPTKRLWQYDEKDNWNVFLYVHTILFGIFSSFWVWWGFWQNKSTMSISSYILHAVWKDYVPRTWKIDDK